MRRAKAEVSGRYSVAERFRALELNPQALISIPVLTANWICSS